MLDIRLLRSEPDVVKAAVARRETEGLEDAVDEILALDERRRAALREVNELKAQRNEVSKEIGRIKRDGGDGDEMIVEMREVGARISAIDEEVGRAEERIRELWPASSLARASVRLSSSLSVLSSKRWSSSRSPGWVADAWKDALKLHRSRV